MDNADRTNELNRKLSVVVAGLNANARPPTAQRQSDVGYVNDLPGTQAMQSIEGERLLLRFGNSIADQPAIDVTTLQPARIVALIEERLAKAEPSKNSHGV